MFGFFKSSNSSGTTEIKNYGVFTDGINLTNNKNKEINAQNEAIKNIRAILQSDGVFMGPIRDSSVKALASAEKKLSIIEENLATVSMYLAKTSESYQNADSKACEVIMLNTQTGKMEIAKSSAIYANTTSNFSVKVPDDISQSGYTVTCYGKGGWHLGASAEATRIARGTRQESVHEKWVQNGARYKNGIAVMNVNGVDHYLIATASTFGKVGDSVNVTFKNGQSIPCVIADAKSSNDSNYTKYGHAKSGGSINVLEFEVDRKKYLSSGNPTTSKWNLEWDSSSGVSRVDNHGTII